MAATLIARIQKLEQYKPEEKKLYWRDTTPTRWQNVYSKLEKDFPAIYLTDGKVLIGKIEAIQPGEGFSIKEVAEYAISNDDFLRLAEVTPENISTIKANFHPFIAYINIDFVKLVKDIQQKNFISFYIVHESAVNNLYAQLKENDRVIIVSDSGQVLWLHQVKKGELRNLDEFKTDLFGSKDMLLQHLRQLHIISERKNNIAATDRMLAGLGEQGYYKFKTFTEYYNIIHNKKLYHNINEEEALEDVEEKNINSNFILPGMNLNLILYGPPGTGKTYHTINKSVAITNPKFDIATSTREQLKAEYERLVKDGQIEFITFHQSMSYEDFIEGIKPVEPKVEDEFLKYEIKDGIFKRLCEKASKVPEAKQTGFSISDDEFQKASFYKMSLGDTSNPDDDQIYEWCIKNGYIALGRGDANDFTGLSENDIQQMVPGQLEKFSAQALNYFIHYAKMGDYVIVSYGNLQFRAIGKITGNYEFKNVEGLQVHQFRKVDWLWTGAELPYEEIYDRQFSQQSIYKMDKRGLKKEFLVRTGNAVPVDNKVKNYVLIIDEINRGNVSQIFGELITLIEEDKRSGKEEALTATLPYSKKAFSVPPNLYIIGTMNTADRSVEALDTALRRRFSFEPMLPDAAIITESPEGIDLPEMLNTINARLEALLSKDHTIGHAWLMKIDTLEKLQSAFKNKILPLLQEFFYNDYAKIGLVLGKSFVESKTVGKQFAKFDDELASDFADKIIYSLKNPFDLKAGDFTSIYQ